MSGWNGGGPIPEAKPNGARFLSDEERGERAIDGVVDEVRAAVREMRPTVRMSTDAAAAMLRKLGKMQ